MSTKFNKQDVFNRVATHLLQQGAKSVHAGTGRCCYRGPDGLMCAVGCLIPDKLYDPALNFSSIYQGKAQAMLGLDESLDCEQVVFLSQLQSIHDSHMVESWPAHLREFANGNGLTLPPCLK